MKKTYNHIGSEVMKDGTKFWGFILNEDNTPGEHFYYTIDLDFFNTILEESEYDYEEAERRCIRYALRARHYDTKNIIIKQGDNFYE